MLGLSSLRVHDARAAHHVRTCPLCFWEDDPHQSAQPENTDGVNGVSLNDGRQTYSHTGAMAPEFLSKVHPPTHDETRERNQKTQDT